MGLRRVISVLWVWLLVSACFAIGEELEESYPSNYASNFDYSSQQSLPNPVKSGVSGNGNGKGKEFHHIKDLLVQDMQQAETNGVDHLAALSNNGNEPGSFGLSGRQPLSLHHHQQGPHNIPNGFMSPENFPQMQLPFPEMNMNMDQMQFPEMPDMPEQPLKRRRKIRRQRVLESGNDNGENQGVQEMENIPLQPQVPTAVPAVAVANTPPHPKQLQQPQVPKNEQIFQSNIQRRRQQNPGRQFHQPQESQRFEQFQTPQQQQSQGQGQQQRQLQQPTQTTENSVRQLRQMYHQQQYLQPVPQNFERNQQPIEDYGQVHVHPQYFGKQQQQQQQQIPEYRPRLHQEEYKPRSNNFQQHRGGNINGNSPQYPQGQAQPQIQAVYPVPHPQPQAQPQQYFQNNNWGLNSQNAVVPVAIVPAAAAFPQSHDQMHPAPSNRNQMVSSRQGYSTLNSRASSASYDDHDRDAEREYYGVYSGGPSYDHYEEDEPSYDEPKKKRKGKKPKKPKYKPEPEAIEEDEGEKEDSESFPKRIYKKTKNAIVSTTKAVFGAPKFIYTRYKAAYKKYSARRRNSEGQKRADKGSSKGWGKFDGMMTTEKTKGWSTTDHEQDDHSESNYNRSMGNYEDDEYHNHRSGNEWSRVDPQGFYDRGSMPQRMRPQGPPRHRDRRGNFGGTPSAQNGQDRMLSLPSRNLFTYSGYFPRNNRRHFVRG